MTKTRSDAWGEDLPEETRWRLVGELNGAKWEDVRRRLSAEGIVDPSPAGWYRFLGRMRERAAAKAVISVGTAKRIAEGMAAEKIDPKLAADVLTALSVDEATKPPEERSEKAMQIFASAAALFAASARGNEELSLRAKSQRTKDAQLKLAREKFEAAERRLERVAEIADAARGGKVDPAKVADEIDRILGRKK